MNRRNFIKNSSLASAALLAANNAMAIKPGIANFPNFAPKIKRVIHLYMAGGPSQFESFDYKPMLAKMDGKVMPASLTAGKQLAQLQGKRLYCMAPRFKFNKYGQSGMEISERFPHLAKLADEL
ncbi:MAG: DUF1501 domain-containing protein [Lentisphaeraceae bacterium]|nr:DUF1501 domain-containing protein [Lentisphaeraceae bacterium]